MISFKIDAVENGKVVRSYNSDNALYLHEQKSDYRLEIIFNDVRSQFTSYCESHFPNAELNEVKIGW